MISRNIEGRERFFEFGMRTFVFIHKLTGVNDMPEVFERLANKKRSEVEGEFLDEAIMGQIEHMEFVAKFLFAAAKTASELNEEPIDYNEGSIYAWIDTMGWSDCLSLIQELSEIYILKNLKAPRQGPKKEIA